MIGKELKKFEAVPSKYDQTILILDFNNRFYGIINSYVNNFYFAGSGVFNIIVKGKLH